MRYIGSDPMSSIHEANGVWSINDVCVSNKNFNWPNPRFEDVKNFMSLETPYNGEPFCNIIADQTNSIVSLSGLSNLDAIFLGEPFLVNKPNTLNSTNPIINYISTDPNFDPYWNNVSLLIRGSGVDGSTNILDSSSYNHSITLPTAGGTNNTAISSGSYIFDNNGSILFDGNADYLQLPVSTSLDFDNSPYTVEFWMRTAGVQSTFSTMISKTSGATNIFAFGVTTGSNGYTLNQNTIAPNYTLLTNGSWHHVALVRDGTNGSNARVYCDGTLSSSSSTVSNASVSLSGGRIGRWQGNDLIDNNYYGYLCELRITKGIARYTSNFTPQLTRFAGA